MKRRISLTSVLVFGLLALCQTTLWAQPYTAPFNLVGYIESFSLAPGCTSADPLCDAFMKVNGITVHIPRNTIIFLPANLLTANDIFKHKAYDHPKASPGDALQPFSGLALEDPAPFTPVAPFEAEVSGNILQVPGSTRPEYIAGIVKISQQSLNTSDGYIIGIDSAKGELLVGPEGTSATDPNLVRVRINDPVLPAPVNTGRFSVGGSFDERFKADQENPTIHSATGYPMCIPRGATDPLCPSANRPVDSANRPLRRFTMGPVDAMTALAPGAAAAGGNLAAPPCPACNPNQQAPFRIGDRITYAGAIALDKAVTPPTKYMSAHTITADVAVFTQPGIDPAYLSVDGSLIGGGGVAFSGVDQETGPGKIVPGAISTTRFRVEVTVTDPSRSVQIFALDYTGPNGTQTERSFALPAFAKLRPAGASAFMTLAPTSRPPFGRLRLNVDRANFLPAPREIRVRYAGAPAGATAANGVNAGSYDAPVGEYLFSENLVVGQRPVPASFENLCFLWKGIGQLNTLGRGMGAIPPGPVVGKLSPWPESGHPNPESPCP